MARPSIWLAPANFTLEGLKKQAVEGNGELYFDSLQLAEEDIKILSDFLWLSLNERKPFNIARAIDQQKLTAGNDLSHQLSISNIKEGLPRVTRLFFSSCRGFTGRNLEQLTNSLLRSENCPEELSFDECDVGDKEITPIINLIEARPTIRQVSLNCNRIGPIKAIQLGFCMEKDGAGYWKPRIFIHRNDHDISSYVQQGQNNRTAYTNARRAFDVLWIETVGQEGSLYQEQGSSHLTNPQGYVRDRADHYCRQLDEPQNVNFAKTEFVKFLSTQVQNEDQRNELNSMPQNRVPTKTMIEFTIASKRQALQEQQEERKDVLPIAAKPNASSLQAAKTKGIGKT